MKLVLDDVTEYKIVHVDTMTVERGVVECALDERTPEEVEHDWKGIRSTGFADVRLTIRLKTMGVADASALLRIVAAERIKEDT